MPLAKSDIVAGLKELGLSPGVLLLVHSSLSSLGQVEGGADAVIDALLEALGPAGTLLMPTHPARDGHVFDPTTVPSVMGRISETFWRRPGVKRSRHPYHPVAACGPRATELLRDHEQSAIPDGPNTPYGRLISLDGQVLLLGCDLDTLTLVHTVEAELELPYLRELSMPYVDDRGGVQTLAIRQCPGGHRGGVLKFDRLFQAEGAMRVGRIGRAVCRLLSAPQAAAIMRRELSRDPFFVLDDNLHCADCTRFRARLKSVRLAKESFRLTAPLKIADLSRERALALIQGEGIAGIEVEAAEPELVALAFEDFRQELAARGHHLAVLRTGWPAPARLAALCAAVVRLEADYLYLTGPTSPQFSRADTVTILETLVEMATAAGFIVLLTAQPGGLVETIPELVELITGIGSPHLGAGYHPAAIAGAGGSPFYGGLYQGPLRRLVRHISLSDRVAATGQAVPPGRGNAELIEIISALRCRSYDGIFCLEPLSGPAETGFRAAAQAFWSIMDSI